MKIAIGRTIGHARFLPFGLRDRTIRFLIPPQSRPHHPFVSRVGSGRYAGNLDNFIDWSVFFYGLYERYLLRALGSIITRQQGQSCLWDVGANSGQHTVFAASMGAAVAAFEPYGPLLNQLRRNAELNPSLPISIYPFGLANVSGDQTYHSPNGENQATGHFANGGDIVLPLRRGDDVEVSPPTVIKIDVEGFEGEALRGAAQTIQRARPIILCENSERTKSTESDLRALLPAEYRAFDIVGVETPALIPFSNAGRGEMALFCPVERLDDIRGIKGA